MKTIIILHLVFSCTWVISNQKPITRRGSFASFGPNGNLAAPSIFSNSYAVQHGISTKDVKVPIHHPHPVTVDKPYPVHIPQPYLVAVERPVPFLIEQQVPIAVEVPFNIPITQPVAVPVPKPIPVPVKKHAYEENGYTNGFSASKESSFAGSANDISLGQVSSHETIYVDPTSSGHGITLGSTISLSGNNIANSLETSLAHSSTSGGSYASGGVLSSGNSLHQGSSNNLGFSQIATGVPYLPNHDGFHAKGQGSLATGATPLNGFGGANSYAGSFYSNNGGNQLGSIVYGSKHEASTGSYANGHKNYFQAPSYTGPSSNSYGLSSGSSTLHGPLGTYVNGFGGPFGGLSYSGSNGNGVPSGGTKLNIGGSSGDSFSHPPVYAGTKPFPSGISTGFPVKTNGLYTSTDLTSTYGSSYANGYGAPPASSLSHGSFGGSTSNYFEHSQHGSHEVASDCGCESGGGWIPI